MFLAQLDARCRRQSLTALASSPVANITSPPGRGEVATARTRLMMPAAVQTGKWPVQPLHAPALSAAPRNLLELQLQTTIKMDLQQLRLAPLLLLAGLARNRMKSAALSHAASMGPNAPGSKLHPGQVHRLVWRRPARLRRRHFGYQRARLL